MLTTAVHSDLIMPDEDLPFDLDQLQQELSGNYVNFDQARPSAPCLRVYCPSFTFLFAQLLGGTSKPFAVPQTPLSPARRRRIAAKTVAASAWTLTPHLVIPDC